MIFQPEQFLDWKKKEIKNPFLKGYNFLEHIITILERKIKNKIYYIPNLIFMTKGKNPILEFDRCFINNNNNNKIDKYLI